MVNKDIVDLLSNLPHALVKSDSAEPKSIEEIKRHGINIIGATKGPGSVNQRIQYVRGLRISVTNRSTNLLKEYRNYLWQTDKEGKIINEPQEFMNHCMDAIGYGFDGAVLNKFVMPKSYGGIKPLFPGFQ
jgi:phage terminase large subunit